MKLYAKAFEFLKFDSIKQYVRVSKIYLKIMHLYKL